MTINEAIDLLDLETREKALEKYRTEKLGGVGAFLQAAIVAADELRKRQWISVEDRRQNQNKKY